MTIITQEPNKNNTAYVPNVWTLSNLAGADRFVLKVVINSVEVVTYKQPANPAGVAHFDISKVLQAYMTPEFVELTQRAADTERAHLTYRVRYGTETGNEEGTITEYPFDKYVINAYDKWNVLNSDLSDFIPEPGVFVCENSNVTPRYSNTYSFLTNYPNQSYKVRSDEYKTLSFYNRIANFDDGTNWGPNEAPFFISIKYFNAGGTQVAQGVYALSSFNGSSVRTDCRDMTCSFDDNNIIATIGVGPQNQKDDGINFDALNAASYRVEVYSYNNCVNTTIADCNDISEIIADGYLGDVIYTADFEVEDDCTPFDPITISFMNQYGVKDYFTMDRRNTKTVRTTRNNYYRDNGTYDASTFTLDTYGRGQTTFSSEAVTTMSLQSNWMDDATSKWLQELYTSSSVMAFVEGAWEPCVLNIDTYKEKTYARDRMFQHEITIEFANTKNMQRG